MLQLQLCQYPVWILAHDRNNPTTYDVLPLPVGPMMALTPGLNIPLQKRKRIHQRKRELYADEAGFLTCCKKTQRHASEAKVSIPPHSLENLFGAGSAAFTDSGALYGVGDVLEGHDVP